MPGRLTGMLILIIILITFVILMKCLQFIFLISTALVVSSLSKCRRPDCEDTRPSIEFKDFIQFQDSSGKLLIGFHDCDGNIGLDDGDTLPPYDLAGGYYYNLKMEYYEMNNGTWEKILLSIPFYYRIPLIEPDGNNKTLDGEIAVDISPWYFDPFSPNSDTVKFDITLIDRDLQISNTVSTSMLVIPK